MAYDGVGTSGNFLKTSGAGTLPVWDAAVGPTPGNFTMNVQTFTADGVYTPSAGLAYAVVELVGGGGGGAGAVGTSTQTQAGSGGGGGGYSRKLIDAATIGASEVVTIGVGGAGGGPGGNGSSGGTTIFGAIFQATGGGPGLVATATTGTGQQPGGTGGSGSGGDININGGFGGGSFCGGLTYPTTQGNGGSSFYAPTTSLIITLTSSGVTVQGGNGLNYGGGGAGSFCANTGGTNSLSGGNGAPGVCIVTEYIA